MQVRPLIRKSLAQLLVGRLAPATAPLVTAAYSTVQLSGPSGSSKSGFLTKFWALAAPPASTANPTSHPKTAVVQRDGNNKSVFINFLFQRQSFQPGSGL